MRNPPIKAQRMARQVDILSMSLNEPKRGNQRKVNGSVDIYYKENRVRRVEESSVNMEEISRNTYYLPISILFINNLLISSSFRKSDPW
jgi:hypothetical protein